MGQPTAASKPASDLFAPLTARGIEVVEFTVAVGDRKVAGVIGSPPAGQLAADPVLLLTIGGATTHFLPPNQQPAEHFWKRGHRVVSFSFDSMPGALELLRDDVMKGGQPFERFIADAKAVLKHCVDQGWAKPDRIVVTGISRFGYLALRLMAADENLNIGAGFAPVTDWRDLSEFAGQRDLQQIADLRLSLYAEKLAGKKIYMAIGSHDERVNTRSACQLFLDLNTVNRQRGFGPELVDFHITPDPDHRCGDEWFERGMKLLLDHALAQKKQ